MKLIGIRKAGQAVLIQQEEFNGAKALTLNRAQLLRLAAAEQVVAIVSYDEPTELVQQYAPYVLTVNGTLQPGGGSVPPQP